MLIKTTSSHFFYLQDKIEQEIAASIVSFGEKTKLRDACEYALLSGGKRLRPLIVLMTAEALDNGLNVYPVALGVEFLHTASLIADDLPCMDDDDQRRNKPALHKVYGENIALLSSYALICAGFERIHQNAEIMKQAPSPFAEVADQACTLALGHAAHCAGILGATGGQFLDLFPPQYTLESFKELIYKKTITLFEVSLCLGWIFGGGSIEQFDRVKKAAQHLGMAFQIADDLEDINQDDKGPNIAKFLGKERCLAVFQNEMSYFKEELIELDISTPSFEKMCDFLTKTTQV
ncbi:MAG TPA: polyprenyl synthetase family protein [Rhabdochlamydiaceae bacterium]|nr:polyprenyl synthetase family protein [Rhabdochlamydiaceae bacterium]